MPMTRAAAMPVLEVGGAGVRVLIGGELLGRRHMWWNFVSSRPERIVQAAGDWLAQRYPAMPGETDLTPLPERRPA